MGYDDDFYKMYRDYLSEPAVRGAHDWIFAIARLNRDFQDVVDFGCGAFNEFNVYARPSLYLGIDVNAPADDPLLIQVNYRQFSDLTQLFKQTLPPTAFVSLFSTEITAPREENYAFYEKVFGELPTVKSGLVSGFYYASKKGTNPIGETGGILSYQTLERLEDVSSALFSERRIVLPIPSKMFGPDVFEVWKFFDRK